MINLFNSIALGFVGHARGGPAKVAVISSGMMGTISGSGVANVLTVGPVHDSADEALRLLAGLRRRRRGDGEHGRPDHAAGDGRRRLHHGRDAQPALRRRSSRPRSSRRSSITRRRSGWCTSKRAAPACTGMPKAECPNPWEAIRRKLVPDAAAGGAGLHAVRRLHADVRRHRRPRADGDADPRRRHRRRLLGRLLFRIVFWIGARARDRFVLRSTASGRSSSLIGAARRGQRWSSRAAATTLAIMREQPRRRRAAGDRRRASPARSSASSSAC